LIDIKQVLLAVESCELCSTNILLESNSLNQQNPKLKYEWREGINYCPEKKYPVSCQPSKLVNGKLVLEKLSFEYIRKGVTQILRALINKEVSEFREKSYLKYLGLNTDAQEYIVKDALHKNELWYNPDGTVVVMFHYL
jgi:hypothetical protein